MVTTNRSQLAERFTVNMALSGRPRAAIIKMTTMIRINQPVLSVPSNIPIFYAEGSKADPLVVLCGQLRNWNANLFK